MTNGSEWDEPYGVRGKPANDNRVWCEVSEEADPKIGGAEKTQNEAKREFHKLADERERLVNVLGVDPDELEPINEPPSYQWDQNPRGKDSNPKDAIGSRKAGLSMLPRQVMYEVALGMLEGALKYARHNYRIAGVRASVYVDANSRHMDAFWEGQDIDPGSGLHHVVKAIASLVVLRDSMLAGNWYDDRPPSIGDPNWLEWYNKEAERIIDDFDGEPKKPFIKGDNE